MSRLKNLESVAIGDYIETGLTGLNKNNSDAKNIEAVELMNQGIGKVILVENPEGVKIKVVIEDIDFITNPDKKRYIFAYYSKNSEQEIYVDTLYDKGWTIDATSL